MANLKFSVIEVGMCLVFFQTPSISNLHLTSWTFRFAGDREINKYLVNTDSFKKDNDNHFNFYGEAMHE